MTTARELARRHALRGRRICFHFDDSTERKKERMSGLTTDRCIAVVDTHSTASCSGLLCSLVGAGRCG